MFVVQCSLNIIDSRIGHSTALKNIQPLLSRLLLSKVLNQSINISAVLYTITIGDEASIGLPFRVTETIGQYTKETVITTTKKNVTIQRLVASVRHNRCCR